MLNELCPSEKLKKLLEPMDTPDYGILRELLNIPQPHTPSWEELDIKIEKEPEFFYAGIKIPMQKISEITNLVDKFMEEE